VIAGHVYGVHPGKTVEQVPAAGNDVVQRVAKQFKDVAQEDQLPSLVGDIGKELVEHCLAIALPQVVFGGSIPHVQVADDKHWLVRLVDGLIPSFSYC